MRIEIHGHDLPRRTVDASAAASVEVGLQCGKEVVQRHAASADAVHWSAEVTATTAADGTVDLRGPCVHGKRGDRFLYLSWGAVTREGEFEMFRRAKLMLAAVEPATMAAASLPGGTLVAELGLSGADGTPLCAAVRPPAVQWRAAAS